MGISGSWIVVRGLNRTEIAQRLGLEETARRVEPGEAFLMLGDMGNGWLVLRAGEYGYATPELLATISAGGEALSCQVEEHVMVNEARGFRDGREVWSAEHDPGKGTYSLVVTGEPPPELAAIEKDQRAKQDAEGGEDAGVDFMFDAAPEIVATLSGYRDDMDQGVVFAELRRIQPPRGPGLFQRLFRRR